LKRSVALVAVVGVLAVVAFSVGRTTAPRADRAGAARRPDVRADNHDRIHITAGLAERAGVRVATIERRQMSPSLQLVGSVEFDADRVADVGGRIAGRITRMFVTPGMDIRAGAPLAEIESASLGDAIATYLSSRANLIAARANLNRELALHRQQLTTAAALEASRARAQALEAEVRGAEQRLLAMGAEPREIRGYTGASRDRHVTLRAPISGRVITRQAVLGQVVEATSTVMRIADLAELWVQLDLFERDLARVRIGDRAEISSETYPGRLFHGVVSHLDSTIDLRTRTARVRIEVDNTDLVLRPGQFVTARVQVSGTSHTSLSIPRSALVQLEGRDTVFVRVAPEEYEPRDVQLGVAEGETVEVVRGLENGDSLVIEGAFALKSELQR